MGIGLYIRVASRNLLRARRRTLLLSSALGLVTGLLVMLLSLSHGITDNMIHAATTLQAGHVNVAGFFKTRPTDAGPFVVRTPEIRKVIGDTLGSDIDFVIDRQRGWAKVVSDTGSVITGLSGVEPTQEKALFQQMVVALESDYKKGGRAERVGTLADMGKPGTIVLFADQARRLGVVPGDSVTIVADTFGGATNSIQLTVAGIAENIGMLSNWSTFVSRSDVQGIYQLKPDTTGAVMIYLKDINKVNQAMGRLRDAFEKAGWSLMPHEEKAFFMKFDEVSGEDWTGQKLDITSWSDEVVFLKWVINGFNVIATFLTFILGIIIVVGIMNTMWISVRERTGEIGTLRAIGMQRSRVLALFMIEALVLGLTATTVGALAGAGAAYLLDAARVPLTSDAAQAVLISHTLHLAVGGAEIIKAIAVFSVVTAVAAIWPSLRAARLQPVTAIQAA